MPASRAPFEAAKPGVRTGTHRPSRYDFPRAGGPGDAARHGGPETPPEQTTDESTEEYLEALEESKRLATSAIDSTLQEHDLDALIAPTNSPAWPTDHINGDSFHVGSSSLAAISGYPSVTVPAGFVSGLPVGISFMGAKGHDRQLIGIAHAFEQVARVRRPPDH